MFQKQVGVSHICVNVSGNIRSVMKRSVDPEATVPLTAVHRVKNSCSLANSC